MKSSVIPTKTSVTKVKEADMEKEQGEAETIVSIEEIIESKSKQVSMLGAEQGQGEDENTEESKFAIARPKFLNETNEITPAQKGTLMHYCFQKLNEKEEYNRDKIKQMIDDFVNKKLMTELEAKAININKLVSYTKSDLFKALKNAKEVHKEQPFYINLKADEIYENGINDNILVQGIIDLYFINEDDEIVLVDYKTDYVDSRHRILGGDRRRQDVVWRTRQESFQPRIGGTCVPAYLFPCSDDHVANPTTLWLREHPYYRRNYGCHYPQPFQRREIDRCVLYGSPYRPYRRFLG